FYCPDGGDFYICFGSWLNFIGCCASDPCTNGPGVCPDEHLRTTTYNATALRDISSIFWKCFSGTASTKTFSCRNSKPAARFRLRSTYVPVLSQTSSADTASESKDYIPASDGQWSEKALGLRWFWNIILTLIPFCFLGLAIVALHLDGQQRSDYGEKAMEMTRLGPTVFPIVFAAIASRFYKCLARWCLEKKDGITLASLEQIFGSQSLAAAFERLFSIRTRNLLGLTLLLTWMMSPIGGQSASRVLFIGDSATTANTTIYYLHPSYQRSRYLSWATAASERANIVALYTANLFSSLEQQRSVRDPWNLPKIPQWSRSAAIGEMYDINETALTRGDEYYSSLLGIRLQGLDLEGPVVSYDFSIVTSYVDFQCAHVGYLDDSDDAILSNKDQMLKVRDAGSDTEHFAVNITMPESWDEWTNLRNPPPLHMLYMSRINQTVSLANCTMQLIVLETNMRCGPRPSTTSCSARRQRRINGPPAANRLPYSMLKNPASLQKAFSLWPEALGVLGWEGSSLTPTDNYIISDYRYGPIQMNSDKWPTVYSRRLTTVFNTFWETTLNPRHSNVTFETLPQMNDLRIEDLDNFWNSTVGTVARSRKILAILGLLLQGFVRGPDVLGFASTMTRDNPYVLLPPGGSRLDGPERARRLGDLRLQLAD
ncbi:hypothetical protein B0T10DRAFT_579538, partial [Thelonectria olida]